MSQRAEKQDDGFHLTLDEIEKRLAGEGWGQEADKIIKDLLAVVHDAEVMAFDIKSLLDRLTLEGKI
jgi:hypothetical protein